MNANSITNMTELTFKKKILVGYICPVVGRVSMDAITVKLPDEDCYNRDLYIIKDDFTSPNSAVELAKQLQTITYEVTTSLTARLARVYVTNETLYMKK